MRPILYSINVTADGCCDHRAGRPDEELHRHAARLVGEADLLLFGRVVYGMMEEAWRPVAEAGRAQGGMPDWTLPFAQAIHRAPKAVVSDTLPAVDWNAELVRGAELEAAVRRLKAQPGGRILTGGVALPRALMALGLIDEVELVVHPRIAGHGPYVFEGLARMADLEATGREAFAGGAVALRYRVAGA